MGSGVLPYDGVRKMTYNTSQMEYRLEKISTRLINNPENSAIDAELDQVGDRQFKLNVILDAPDNAEDVHGNVNPNTLIEAAGIDQVVYEVKKKLAKPLDDHEELTVERRNEALDETGSGLVTLYISADEWRAPDDGSRFR